MCESFDNIVNNIHPDNQYEKLKMPIPLTNPTYGCLKNGKLPTYRQYMKNNAMTQKGPIHNMHSHSHYVSQPIHSTKSSYAPPVMPTKPPASTIPIQLKMPPSSQIPAIKQVAPVSNIIHPPVQSSTVTHPIGSTLEEIKQNERLKNISEIKQLREILEKKQREKNKSATASIKRKTIKKRTYYLGKSKVHPKVSVLVSNKTIRNQVNKKAHDLKQTSMSDVKKYLMQKGFIKVGSTAPHDVLRRMYESAQMIGGEITNYNSDNLLYNYLNA
jgi:hypothetical protein